MLYAIAFVNGTIMVLDAPSRQQLTYRMVGRETLPNAIALNSSLFNASRILGPSVAGILLGFAGVGVCFLVNAISFVAVLGGLLMMRTSEFFPLEEFERPSIFAGTKEGLAFVRTQPRMLAVLGLTLVLSTFAFNFNVTLPVLAKITLHGNGAVFGFLSAVFGAGALVGALVAASRAKASARVLLIGAAVFAGAELLLAPATNVARRRAAVVRRGRRLHRVVGELAGDPAARRAGSPARPHHRPLLLRVHGNGAVRRAVRRLAVRQGRDGAGVRRRRRSRARRGRRDCAQARLDAALRAAPPPRDASQHA